MDNLSETYKNEINRMEQLLTGLLTRTASSRKGITLEVTIRISPEETKQHDWYSLAETYLQSRTRAKDYRGLSIELLAMERAGLHRRPFAPTVQMLANTLTVLLGWPVSSRNLSQRLADLDTYKTEDQIEQSENFWRSKLS